MEESLEKRSTESITEELNYLENSYAECLRDDVDVKTLNRLWNRMKALKVELERRGLESW